jgi:hypothetical protein
MQVLAQQIERHQHYHMAEANYMQRNQYGYSDEPSEEEPDSEE